MGEVERSKVMDYLNAYAERKCAMQVLESLSTTQGGLYTHARSRAELDCREVAEELIAMIDLIDDAERL